MKKTNTPNKPKRPSSAYIRFTSELRKKDTAVQKMSVGEAASFFSKKWAEYPPEGKKRLTDEYNQEMVGYNELFKAYKLTDEYKESLKKTSKLPKNEKKTNRNISPYNAFVASYYEKKKKEGDCDFKAVTAEASEKWSSMTEAEKKVYSKKAAEVNEARKEKENKI